MEVGALASNCVWTKLSESKPGEAAILFKKSGGNPDVFISVFKDTKQAHQKTDGYYIPDNLSLQQFK